MKLVKFIIWDLVLMISGGIVTWLIQYIPYWREGCNIASNELFCMAPELPDYKIGFPWPFILGEARDYDAYKNFYHPDFQAFIYDFIFWGLIVLAIWLIARQRKAKS